MWAFKITDSDFSALPKPDPDSRRTSRTILRVLKFVADHAKLFDTNEPAGTPSGNLVEYSIYIAQ